jgi:hypothetical protein
MLLDQALHSVTTGPLALAANHAQHIELADQIAEDGCAVAGH